MLSEHEHRRPERKGKGSTADLRILGEEGYLDRTWSMDGVASQERAAEGGSRERWFSRSRKEEGVQGPRGGFDAEMGAVQSWKSMLAVGAACASQVA